MEGLRESNRFAVDFSGTKRLREPSFNRFLYISRPSTSISVSQLLLFVSQAVTNREGLTCLKPLDRKLGFLFWVPIKKEK
jgi:hypothetical protein